MADKIHAPFTDKQVIALNAFQVNGQFHPFTCRNDSRHRPLAATRDGWFCFDCDYSQNWAHTFMTYDLRHVTMDLSMNTCRSCGHTARDHVGDGSTCEIADCTCGPGGWT